MAHIDLPSTYDFALIAREAELGGLWGVTDLGGGLARFDFSPSKVEAVEAVLASYTGLVLAQAKAVALGELSTRRGAAELAFTFGGSPIRLDESTQARITGAVTSYLLTDALGQPSTPIRWQVAKGVFVTLDKTAIYGLGLAARAHVQACFETADTLATAINAANTLADLQAIDLDAGWPGSA
jgi:hypothetical protein